MCEKILNETPEEIPEGLSEMQLTTLAGINEVACYLTGTQWLDTSDIYKTAVKIYDLDQQHKILDGIMGELENIATLLNEIKYRM